MNWNKYTIDGSRSLCRLHFNRRKISNLIAFEIDCAIISVQQKSTILFYLFFTPFSFHLFDLYFMFNSELEVSYHFCCCNSCCWLLVATLNSFHRHLNVLNFIVEQIGLPLLLCISEIHNYNSWIQFVRRFITLTAYFE